MIEEIQMELFDFNETKVRKNSEVIIYIMLAYVAGMLLQGWGLLIGGCIVAYMLNKKK